jgi:hypothetical protein
LLEIIFFWGLCSEINFLNRLPQIGKNIFYDLPPYVLFSQKATLVLPFWSKTKHLFSDEIRNIINYSVPLLPEVIELEDGLVTIEEFSNLPRSKRGYFLKYAGSKVTASWGSYGVFRLSNLNGKNCLNLLKQCIEKFSLGEIWLIQKENTHDDNIAFFNRNFEITERKLRLKLNTFYAPKILIGTLAMHRNFYKVHGLSDTVISFVAPAKSVSAK